MGEENKGNKINFFKKVIMSIKDFDRYVELALLGTKSAIAYLAIVLVIFIFVTGLVFTYQFSKSVDNFKEFIRNEVQTITYENETLAITTKGNNKWQDTTNSVLPPVIFATDKEQITEEMMQENEIAIILLKDKIVMQNGTTNQKIGTTYQELASQYGVTSFQKEDVIKVVENISLPILYSGFFITIFIYLYIIYFISTITDVFMLMIFGYIVARIAGIKLKFKATWNMATYALTLPILLNLIYIVVNALTGFNIRYFQWMYTTISYIYLIVAILMIKSDMLNRQMELIRIKEEEKKVKEELQQKDNTNEEKKEKDQEPSDKQKNKDDNLGEEGGLTSET